MIRRALAKQADARYPTAVAMSAELRAIPISETQMHPVSSVRALVRLVVPPLRLLREDPDSAFLSYALAETLSGSLASLPDVVVRSPALAANWAASGGDPRRLAAEADVDIVVSGSLVRVGEQIRATLQVIEASTGTVLGARSLRGEMADIFGFEDQLAQGAIGLLAPIRGVAETPAVQRDVPANGRAFEHFLRGLEVARSLASLREARSFFEQAVAEDPAFAPAWAWLGRCHRVIGKYIEDRAGNDRRAEDAFRRALALSPDLPIAHRFYTHFESEHGRADAAIARLLQHARKNRNDAHLFAALVHACRYAGLNGASLAAHEEAARLDPTLPTSVEYTLLMEGDLERLRAMPKTVDVDGALSYLLLLTGHTDEVHARVRQLDLATFPRGYREMIEVLGQVGISPAEEVTARLETAIAEHFDPEATFLCGMVMVKLDQVERGLQQLEAGVRAGFSPLRTLEESPSLEAGRQRAEFDSILAAVRQRRTIALAVFERGGGPTLLGISAEQA